MRWSPLILLIASLGAAALGCGQRARRAPPPVNDGAESPGQAAVVEETPVDRGLPSRLLGGAGAGVVMSLPDGWTVRRVDDGGPVVAIAFGPPSGGVKLELRRWDGETSSVEGLLSGDPWSWSAAGPYATIEAARDEPLVATFREQVNTDVTRDQIGLGWFFFVGERGVGAVARVPAARLEAGFHEAWEVVRTARAPEDT